MYLVHSFKFFNMYITKVLAAICWTLQNKKIVRIYQIWLPLSFPGNQYRGDKELHGEQGTVKNHH